MHIATSSSYNTWEREKGMSKENTTSTTIGFIVAFIGTLILIIDAVTYHLAVDARVGAAGTLLGILILIFAFRAYTTKGVTPLVFSVLIMIVGIVAIILALTVLNDIIAIIGGSAAFVAGIFLMLGKRGTK